MNKFTYIGDYYADDWYFYFKGLSGLNKNNSHWLGLSIKA